MNEICQFRFEIDLCRPYSLSAPVYMEVDLMYADLNTNSVVEERRTPSPPARQPRPVAKPVSPGSPEGNSAGDSGSSPELSRNTTAATAACNDMFSSAVSDEKESSYTPSSEIDVCGSEHYHFPSLHHFGFLFFLQLFRFRFNQLSIPYPTKPTS